MICIIDYGMGNCGSIKNMLRKVGGDAIISDNPAEAEKATSFILPGVGNFDNGMQKLRALPMMEVVEHKVLNEGAPFLGVCLGMQLLFERSTEGVLPGLGWIPGEVRRFQFDPSMGVKKVPHMGWNYVSPKSGCPLYTGFTENPRFYFVHSYHVVCEDEFVVGTTNYGYDFVSSVQKGNIFGTQFHPEKSHKFGMNLFKHYLEYISC